MFSRRFQILLLAIAVAPLCGCRFSSQGLGSFAAHGPCKTLGVDVRPGQGAIGPDVCIHDRCLGWMVARNKGPFYHLLNGTTDPGCGNGNCRSLVGGSHTLVEQFPTDNGSPNPVVNQTAVKRGRTAQVVSQPSFELGSPTPAVYSAPAASTAPVAYHLSSNPQRRGPISTRPTVSKPANRLARERFDPWR